MSANYQRLTHSSLLPYLQQLAALDTQFSEPPHYVNEIQAGNLNQLFGFGWNNKKYILKQALPYIKCLGPEAPLTVKRINYEVAYFTSMPTLMDFFPAIVHTDTRCMHLYIMEDLWQYQALRQHFLHQKLHPHLAPELARLLFKIYVISSHTQPGNDRYQSFAADFRSNPLRQLSRDYIFRHAFNQHPANFYQHQFSERFKRHCQQFESYFLNQPDVLIHGDLHTDSIFVNDDKIKLIDAEFACMGPIAFDIGILFAHIALSFYASLIVDPLSPSPPLLFLQQFWQEVIAIQNSNNQQFSHAADWLPHTIGFMGIEMARRICGVAGVPELRSIQDSTLQSHLNQLALTRSIFMVENFREFSTIESLINFLERDR